MLWSKKKRKCIIFLGNYEIGKIMKILMTLYGFQIRILIRIHTGIRFRYYIFGSDSSQNRIQIWSSHNTRIRNPVDGQYCHPSPFIRRVGVINCQDIVHTSATSIPQSVLWIGSRIRFVLAIKKKTGSVSDKTRIWIQSDEIIYLNFFHEILKMLKKIKEFEMFLTFFISCIGSWWMLLN